MSDLITDDTIDKLPQVGCNSLSDDISNRHRNKTSNPNNCNLVKRLPIRLEVYQSIRKHAHAIYRDFLSCFQ